MTSRVLGRRFGAFYDVVTRLASEHGCPWDREQTVFTLSDNFKEECDELSQAAVSEDTNAIVEELGDVLYLICLSTAAAEKRGSFGMPEVLEAVRRKAVFRHPHVFSTGDTEEVEGAALTSEGSATVSFVRRKAKEHPRFCWGRDYYSK